MKLYGGKFLRNSMDRAAERRVESRDAILYDVDPGTRRARVRIQGSSTLVVVYYPENWEQTPAWLKAGNAVKISHTGGNRSRLELVGHGALIPTPVAGDSGIPTVLPPDIIISGLQVIPIIKASENSRWNCILVTVGTFRISGVTYTRGPIKMGATMGLTRYRMGQGGKMGRIAGYIYPVASASVLGEDVYTAVHISTSLAFGLTAGSQAVNPIVPDVPANTILCGTINYGKPLEYPATNVIGTGNINRPPTSKTIRQVGMLITDADLAIGELSTTITAQVRDAHGNLIDPPAGTSYRIQLAIISGSGYLSTSSGVAGTAVSASTGTSSSIFSYHRPGSDADLSPIIKTTLLDYNKSSLAPITLRDSAGNYLPGA